MRRPTGRLRIAVAVGAALAAVGGVLALPAITGGPVQAAATTAQATAKTAFNNSQAKSILLINGDRLVVAGKSTSVALAGPGFSSALTELRLNGHQYVIPDTAIPFLGRGLDLSLFNVAAQQGGATLPVRISYSGRTPRLPGVTITR